MPSTKGNPTDPKLHDKIVEDVKQQPNKDGERIHSIIFGTILLGHVLTRL